MAQPAIDASSFLATATGNSLTWSHTTGSGSDRFMRVGVTWRGVTGITVSSVAYNSDPLTQLTSARIQVTEGFGSFFVADHWYMVAPDSGAHNIVVSLSVDADAGAGGADTWTGVHQTVPLGSAVTGDGSTSTPSINVTVGTDELALALISCYDDAGFATGDTQSWLDTDNHGRIGSYSLSTGTVTMDFAGVFAGGSHSAMTGVNLKPVGAAGDPEGRLIGGKLLRGGLLRSGVLH